MSLIDFFFFNLFWFGLVFVCGGGGFVLFFNVYILYNSILIIHF